VPWYYEDSFYGVQPGGFLTKFSKYLSFATVHFAGHEVPAYQPEKALTLLKGYLDGSIFYDDLYSTGKQDAGSKSDPKFDISKILVVSLLLTAVFGLFVCFVPRTISESKIIQ
jgi:hypothetical protein